MSSLIKKIDVIINNTSESNARYLNELRSFLITGEFNTKYYYLNMAVGILIKKGNLKIDQWFEILNMACRTGWIDNFSTLDLNKILRFPKLSSYCVHQISDQIFALMIDCYMYADIFMYCNSGYNLITTYERFVLISQKLTAISNYIHTTVMKRHYTNLIRYNQEYFLKSLNEDPERWIIDYDILSSLEYKRDKKIIYDNLPYTRKIAEYINAQDQCDHIELRFLSKILHINKCEIDIHDMDKRRYILELVGAFHNRIDTIEFHYTPYGVQKIVPTYLIKGFIEMLLSKFKIIKQARNYSLSVEHSWKLNFIRMIEFNKNLDTLNSRKI